MLDMGLLLISVIVQVDGQPISLNLCDTAGQVSEVHQVHYNKNNYSYTGWGKIIVTPDYYENFGS